MDRKAEIHLIYQLARCLRLCVPGTVFGWQRVACQSSWVECSCLRTHISEARCGHPARSGAPGTRLWVIQIWVTRHSARSEHLEVDVDVEIDLYWLAILSGRSKFVLRDGRQCLFVQS